MLNIVNTELKLVTSGPDGKPWMLSFHFDNIIAETGSNQMSFWYREHPTMLAIQHMREDAMLWANSEPVIDPFDTYEQHELPSGASKSSCIAHRASELNLPHVDVSEGDLPRVERFSDLPDGTEFYVAQTYAYGGRKLYQKTMEDGGIHNAVEVGNTNMGVRVTGLQLVIRA